MTHEKFILRNEAVKPKAKPQTFETVPRWQQVLWTGLDLLPGQRDFLEETKQAATSGNDPSPAAE